MVVGLKNRKKKKWNYVSTCEPRILNAWCIFIFFFFHQIFRFWKIYSARKKVENENLLRPSWIFIFLEQRGL